MDAHSLYFNKIFSFNFKKHEKEKVSHCLTVRRLQTSQQFIITVHFHLHTLFLQNKLQIVLLFQRPIKGGV